MPIFSTAKNPASPFASLSGDHACVRVPDYEAALAWYRDVLDFRLTASTEAVGLTWAMLAPADTDDFQIELAAGPGEEHPAKGGLHERTGMLGWHHCCLRIASVDDTVDELKRRGVTIVAGPMDFAEIGRRAAFFEDPWGNMFELMEPRRA